ncbi:dephospho-CoA kinase [Jonesia denitrificans DSM 20603]|uniref:Dephospho-CoA kinase n=1 Tax=Jonesia denitrificans (strain ATCC 14870 / DSM 20603 / BCRC 15368 / CIP 55.134 / JCM 11481 / NBRC 15587 / NCTC 10816 / Prevot 55134) TaxID=471856 RepID=C7R431_JONDD|nr:dephospho-CoA kinase [Jonesia denitrificans DSM 20603]SQH20892.1 Dephospho-CoA kinase [Jonesia denitrificans]
MGLTGGIASGKSTVAECLRDLGAVVVDHDGLARQVVEPGSSGLAEIVARFGAGVLQPDGSLDRGALGAVVFGDPKARGLLNSIVHPRVVDAARVAQLAAQEAGALVVVHDIPLLVETGQAGDFDVVLVVEAPEDVRVERMVRDRGMRSDDARARIRAQASDDERRAVADVVFRNDGSRKDLCDQVVRWWDRWSDR